MSHSVTDRSYWIGNEVDIFGNSLGLGLGLITDQKKGLPSPRAEAGQGNIERVHEPEPIQITGLL